VKGHTRVLAFLNGDVQVRPPTLMVNKVTVDNPKYTNILMDTVQAARNLNPIRRLHSPQTRYDFGLDW
jgi:formaldehyde-activating enzyme